MSRSDSSIVSWKSNSLTSESSRDTLGGVGSLFSSTRSWGVLIVDSSKWVLLLFTLVV